ncbi:hypothetical protein CCHL11_10298 [Colletotrichum chlorophyti]|uniref:Modin n=1 Tax=Colletotrichum chlorophyti TaxID=708187 RepID=A0A1Q8S1B6_9PEZI|nr:hypothetical protein CCHL11_10298 [Colletotrichum chlorophyti]
MDGMSEEQFNRTLEVITDKINDDDKELFVAIVALVISVVALVASLLQVAQQYYASAAGYSSCGSKVMGKWSESKKRILKFTEFRFEVQFETPVIFLCPPSNKKGPVKGQPIIFIDGTETSLKDSWTDLQDPNDNVSDKQIAKQAVHTADNERASWVALLSALQKMEFESRKWQRKQYDDKIEKQGPPKGSVTLVETTEVDRVITDVSNKYTLTVAIQKKRRSWDTMPSNVKKPYATTTWCHMVEMLAMLGVYWIEFDRTNDRYRGEGNGYTVTGEKVSDLGIMFTFLVYGSSRFEGNRVIPVDETKELCFGFVPTIYRANSDNRRLKFPNDEPRDLSTLNFASNREVAETLVLIGCNKNTVNYFGKNAMARVEHLFPVAFEIVGMLARTLHIEKSAFRLLPNPTFYRWDTKNFSLPKLLEAYGTQMNKLRAAQPNPSVVGRKIRFHVKSIQLRIKSLPAASARGSWLSLDLLDALHEALDFADKILTAKHTEPRDPAEPTPPPMARNYTTFSRLNRKDSELPEQQSSNQNETTPEMEKRREQVQDVLRSHIQEVLSGFNEKAEKTAPIPPGTKPNLDTRAKAQPLFEDIDAAPPELKQDKLMEVYFQVVRKNVIAESEESTGRREAASPETAPPGYGFRKRQTGISTRTVEDDESIDMSESEDDPTHEDIWCTLVFRMICWLMLHDFHKKDVQDVSKSELLGSRLPVYIS